jgi:hypothetical protein
MTESCWKDMQDAVNVDVELNIDYNWRRDVQGTNIHTQIKGVFQNKYSLQNTTTEIISLNY